MNTNDVAQLAEAESTLWRVLSRSLLRPTVALSEELCGGNYSTAICSLLGSMEQCREPLICIESFEASLPSEAPAQVQRILEVDYNRLFVGPGPLLAPPYESYYESADEQSGKRGRLRTQAERTVAAKYREFGFTMPDTFIELPDHVAIELEFLSILSTKEAQAWRNEDNEEARAFQQEMTVFAKEHVGKWFGACARLIESSASREFSSQSAAAQFYAPVAAIVVAALGTLHTE